ncbi:MAG: hypothetical protein LW636_10035 [Planctomycetaceae bacterium]|nr:hypothetical protein [Planctomycetaceae bacterium]
MNCFRNLTIAVCTSFIAFGAHAEERLSIRSLAPEGALLVVGADDFKGTLTRLEGSALGKLWNDPALAEDAKKLRESFEKQLLKAAEEAGVERESMSWPASAGLAVMIEVDEELGLPSPQFIFFCDWSDDAEKGAKFVETMFANMEKEATANGAKVSFEEIRGRRVMVSPLDSGEAEAGAEDGADDGMDEGMDEFGMDEPSFGPDEICMTADKGRMFMTSSKAGMDMLLGRVDGDRAKAIGDNDKFKSAVDMSGGTQDIYGVLMTEAAKPALAAFPQFMLVEPLIGQLFGNIEAWSFGMHVKDGVLEQSVGIYTPSGKKGLLALADNSTEVKAPPAIVPADAVGYGRINVSFDKVLPVLDEILGGMPAEQAEMIRPQLDIFRPAMGSAFAAMGPEIHMWSPAPGAEDPMGLESGSVTAISMRPDKDSERAVIDFINLLPLGLQSRDFNGRTILSDEFSPFAIGIGGGYMTIGSSQAVEQSMRALDEKDAGGLAADPDFLRAMANMPKNPVVGWSWTDAARQMGMLSQVLPMAMGQMGAMDMGGAGEDEIDPMAVFNLMGKITPEVAKRCMGESMLEFSSVSAGYKTIWRLYPARSE